MTPAFIPGNRARWCETCQGYTDADKCPCCASGVHLCAAEREPQGKLMVEHDGTQTQIWREDV